MFSTRCTAIKKAVPSGPPPSPPPPPFPIQGFVGWPMIAYASFNSTDRGFARHSRLSVYKSSLASELHINRLRQMWQHQRFCQ